MQTKIFHRTILLALLFAAASPHLHAHNWATGTLVQGDFNRDGRPDTAVISRDSTNVSVLLQGANGAFLPPLNFPAHGNPSSMAVGALNGDGILDLVIKNRTALGALIGTFQTARVIALSTGQTFRDPQWNVTAPPALGDFNHDGRLDIATTGIKNNGGLFAPLLLGNGDGTFRTGDTLDQGPQGGMWEAVTVGDFTGDGNLDMMVGNNFGGYYLGVWTSIQATARATCCRIP